MPKISVIVPIYNVEPYIRECVDSILNQTYGDFELILVDDGSPDGCPKICDEYAKLDKRIVVIHKENGGLSSARNAGLDIAKGEYISFVDGDDYLYKEMFEKCMIEAKNNDADSVRFSYVKLKDNTFEKRNFILSQLFEHESEKDKLLFLSDVLLCFKIPFQSCTGFFKSDIIVKHHLRFEDNSRIFSEDIYFSTLFIFCSKNTSFINCPLYVYRDTPGSIMNNTKQSKNIQIDKYNEMSMQIKNKCNLKYIIDNYYILHNSLIMIRLSPYVGILSTKMNAQLSSISDLSYFKTMNKKYYLANKKKFRKKYGLVYGTVIKAFYKYLSTLNYFSYVLRVIIFRIISMPYFLCVKSCKTRNE